ncbi:MAG: hypothetical protein KGJ02_08255 [Verrucomicrobiota bacterium]|nr:hypothetical protein [Verrucomicrobiota bacterium]
MTHLTIQAPNNLTSQLTNLAVQSNEDRRSSSFGYDLETRATMLRPYAQKLTELQPYAPQTIKSRIATVIDSMLLLHDKGTCEQAPFEQQMTRIHSIATDWLVQISEESSTRPWVRLDSAQEEKKQEEPPRRFPPGALPPPRRSTPPPAFQQLTEEFEQISLSGEPKESIPSELALFLDDRQKQLLAEASRAAKQNPTPENLYQIEVSLKHTLRQILDEMSNLFKSIQEFVEAPIQKIVEEELQELERLKGFLLTEQWKNIPKRLPLIRSRLDRCISQMLTIELPALRRTTSRDRSPSNIPSMESDSPRANRKGPSKLATVLQKYYQTLFNFFSQAGESHEFLTPQAEEPPERLPSFYCTAIGTIISAHRDNDLTMQWLELLSTMYSSPEATIAEFESLIESMSISQAEEPLSKEEALKAVKMALTEGIMQLKSALRKLSGFELTMEEKKNLLQAGIDSSSIDFFKHLFQHYSMSSIDQNILQGLTDHAFQKEAFAHAEFLLETQENPNRIQEVPLNPMDVDEEIQIGGAPDLR